MTFDDDEPSPKELKKAIKSLSKEIIQNPKDGPLYLERGCNYGQKGDYDLAIEDFNYAIELDDKEFCNDLLTVMAL